MEIQHTPIVFVEIPVGSGGGLQSSTLRMRSKWLPRIAPLVGVSLRHVTLPTLEETIPGDASMHDIFVGAKAIWWAGPIVFQTKMKHLHSVITQHLQALQLCEEIPIYDLPECVEASFSLASFYPVLKTLGIPQPDTTLIPLDEATIQLPEEDLTQQLKALMGDVAFATPGFFFRTYYSTRKRFPGLHYTQRREDLYKACAQLVCDFREYQEIGGLAIRELLPIALLEDEGMEVLLPRECRVFVVDGQPVMWMCHADIVTLHRLTDNDLRALGHYTPEQRDQILQWSQLIGAQLDARLFALDVTILQDGGLRLLEVNPGHSSGWIHDAAYIGVFGQLFRRLAGLPWLTIEEILQYNKTLHISLEWRDIVFGFFDVASHNNT